MTSANNARVSTGLEDVRDVLADLDSALKAI
jgi:cystathionine beta-lyase/cystathionine gamma-synthase